MTERSTDGGGTLLFQGTYVYDVFNNRVEADEYTSGSGTTTITRSVYADQGTLFADLTSGNAMQTRYLHQDNTQYAPVVARIDSNGVEGLLLDRQGSTRNIINGSGTVIGTLAYGGFGNITSESSPANTGNVTFTGLTFLRNAGVLGATFRIDDPLTGRWDQQDPKRWQAGDANLYRDVGNDPTNATDPTGLEAIATGTGAVWITTGGSTLTEAGAGAGLGAGLGAAGVVGAAFAAGYVISSTTPLGDKIADGIVKIGWGPDPILPIGEPPPFPPFSPDRLDPWLRRLILGPALDLAQKIVEAVAKGKPIPPIGPRDPHQDPKQKACFAADTPILTPDGHKCIGTIREGDLVLARDEHDSAGSVQPKVVEELFVATGQLWIVRVGGRSIETTPEHPFWVIDRGWVGACDLRPGDRLLGHDNRVVTVEEVVDTGKQATVYNFRVADFSTYFVGCDEWGFSVWAHNACAIVYWYPVGLHDPKWPHLSVETFADSGSQVHTEMLDNKPRGTIIASVSAADAAMATAQQMFQLPNGDAAQAFQILQIGRIGPAWSVTNNCFTHVRDVFAAGGVTFPNLGFFVDMLDAAFGFNTITGP